MTEEFKDFCKAVGACIGILFVCLVLMAGICEVTSLAWYKLVYDMSPKEVLIYHKSKHNTHDIRWHSKYDDEDDYE